MSEHDPGTSGPEEPRWPRRLGTTGTVIAVLILLDNLDDLLLMGRIRSQIWWKQLLGEDLGEQVFRALPPPAWMVAAGLVGLALGFLLLVASLRLRDRRRSGVALSRTWSWLAIAWLVVELVQTATVMARLSGGPGAVGPAEWQAYAWPGTAIAFALLLAYPAFLLIWLSRPQVQDETADWPD